jgi:hypothetical protein
MPEDPLLEALIDLARAIHRIEDRETSERRAKMRVVGARKRGGRAA